MSALYLDGIPEARHDHYEIGVGVRHEDDPEVVASGVGIEDWPWFWFHDGFRDPVCACCGFYLVKQDGRWIFGSANCGFVDDSYVTPEDAKRVKAFCRARGIRLKVEVRR